MAMRHAIAGSSPAILGGGRVFFSFRKQRYFGGEVISVDAGQRRKIASSNPLRPKIISVK
jgi:hypothetical protein